MNDSTIKLYNIEGHSGQTNWFKYHDRCLLVHSVLGNNVNRIYLGESEIRSLRTLLIDHRNTIHSYASHQFTGETFTDETGVKECLTYNKRYVTHGSMRLVFPVMDQGVPSVSISQRLSIKYCLFSTNLRDIIHMHLTPNTFKGLESPFIQFCEIIENVYQVLENE